MPDRYAGDADGKGGIFNFVTKRGLCHGDNSKISWTQACHVTSPPDCATAASSACGAAST